jgi:hypothetical protein
MWSKFGHATRLGNAACLVYLCYVCYVRSKVVRRSSGSVMLVAWLCEDVAFCAMLRICKLRERPPTSVNKHGACRQVKQCRRMYVLHICYIRILPHW